MKAAAPDWIPATVLLRELRALGYPGGYSILKDHLADAATSGQAGAADSIRDRSRATDAG